jgi:CubicO group peptidase (beta-lactamase class C family)
VSQRVLNLAFVIVALLSGCGGPIRQLHPVAGNEFTLFPSDRKAPPPITCSGEVDARFECFAKELGHRSRELDVGGAFAFSSSDGQTRTFVRTDELNEARAITLETRFPIGSVSKMFLAAATVSLAQEGKLDLHAPVARYLPELGDAGVGSATLHQLMTHTSGVGNPGQCKNGDEDLTDLLNGHGKGPLLAPPGAVFNYSNLGYSFVAIVVERVTGKRFEVVVMERVLAPAGIPGATFGPDRVAVRGHRAEGSLVGPRCRAMWPSGGLALNIREFAKWGQELAHPESSKLGRPVLELLMAPHVEMDGIPGGAYGYGVGRMKHDGLAIFSHSGRLQDFSAFLAWSPEREVSVAAVSNRSELWVVAAGFRALSTFLSLSPDWQPPNDPAHPLSAYTGIYVDRAGSLGRLSVSVEDEELVLDYLDGPPPLLPATFRFTFDEGASRARYVVTPVGVGERMD